MNTVKRLLLRSLPVSLTGLLVACVLFATPREESDVATSQDLIPLKSLYEFQLPEPKVEVLEKAVVVEAESEDVKTLWGSCRITAYCSCEKCCGKWALNRPIDENGNQIVNGARGTRLTAGYSVACSLPFGTILEIDGLEGRFEVEDRTAQSIQEKYNGYTVDIYFDDHQTCYDYLSGKPEWMDVYIMEEG